MKRFQMKNCYNIPVLRSGTAGSQGAQGSCEDWSGSGGLGCPEGQIEFLLPDTSAWDMPQALLISRKATSFRLHHSLLPPLAGPSPNVEDGMWLADRRAGAPRSSLWVQRPP